MPEALELRILGARAREGQVMTMEAGREEARGRRKGRVSGGKGTRANREGAG